MKLLNSIQINCIAWFKADVQYNIWHIYKQCVFTFSVLSTYMFFIFVYDDDESSFLFLFMHLRKTEWQQTLADNKDCCKADFEALRFLWELWTMLAHRKPPCAWSMGYHLEASKQKPSSKTAQKKFSLKYFPLWIDNSLQGEYRWI